MQTKDAVTLLVFGAALVVVGLMPGFLTGLMLALQNFVRLISGRPAAGPHPCAVAGERLPGQLWFAVAGGFLMILGLAPLVT